MTTYRIPVEETFSWQKPVLDKDLSTPPVSPVKGDRYIVGPTATGDWATKEKNIAWFDGTIWKFDVPAVGWVVFIVDESKQYHYSGSAWTIDTNTSDMTKAVYDTDNDGIVDASEVVTDGGSNTSTAAQVKDAVDKAHTQNTDTKLDEGGANEISAAQAKEAYDKRGTYDSGLGAIIMNL